MITAAQLRAARGLLDWTRAELAEAASISPETVKNIEHGVFRPQEETAERIVKAFSEHDVVFTDDEGVKIRKDNVYRFEGPDGFRRFIDDVYTTVSADPECMEGGRRLTYVSNVDDRLFVQYLGDYTKTHVQRINQLKNVKVRVLVKEDDLFAAPDGDYLEYRGSPANVSGSVPFYVYGNKFAIISFLGKLAPQVVVMNSPLVAEAYRKQFEILWQQAKQRPR